MYEFGVMAYDVAIIRCIVAALERYMSHPWLIEKIQILVWHKHLHCSLIDDLTNHIILIDSFGNEPQIEERKNYILRKER